MRTTLTLEEDVAAIIRRLRHERGDSLKDVVNQALREGLRQLEAKPAADTARFVTDTVSLGRCRIGDLTSVSEALAIAEGDDHR